MHRGLEVLLYNKDDMAWTAIEAYVGPVGNTDEVVQR